MAGRRRRRPRLKLRLRYGKGGGCSRRAARVSIYGRDVRLVKRVQFRLGRRVVATDRRAPFTRRIRVGGARLALRVQARVLLVDGRRIRLYRTVQPCSRGTR